MEYLQTCNAKISCRELTGFIVATRRISHQVSFSYPPKND